MLYFIDYLQRDIDFEWTKEQTMALKLAVLILCVWEQNKKDGTEKEFADLFGGLCNVCSRMWNVPYIFASNLLHVQPSAWKIG